MIVRGRRTNAWLTPVVLLGAAIAGLAVYLGAFAAAVVVAGLSIVLILAVPAAAVPLMIASSALDRFGLSWGDANVRIDLLVVLLLAVVCSNRIAVRTMSLTAFRSPLSLPLVAYAGANLLSTLLFAVERSRGLKLDIEIFTAVLTFVIASALLRRKSDLDVALKALWIVTVGEASLGLVLAAAYLGHATSYGISEVASGFPAIYGTMWEPNVFGSFLSGNFFLLLADYVGHKRGRVYAWGLIIIGAGIVVSLTRTVWIATILGGIAFFIYVHRTRHASPKVLGAAVGAVGLALAALILGSATPLGGRLLNIVNLQSSSASGRIEWFREAIREWSGHPIFGSGTGSWTFGQIPGAPHAWLPSLFLLTLHDTGVLGFGALLWAIWVFYRITIRGARGRSDLSLLAFGSALGFTCLLIAFQTTTGFWFAYPWIVMVVGTTAARLHAEET
jgi:O-antigen ligase